MDARGVADALDTLALLLELQDENPFKVRAYRNAARTMESCTEDLRLLVEQKRLESLPGVGEAIRNKIVQLVTTGRLDALDKARSAVPAGVLDLVRVPTLGPKKARQLWKELGITDLEGLRKACEAGRLAGLKGFGEKTQEKILAGVEFLGRSQGRFLLSEALPLARRLLAALGASGLVQRSSIAGSLRRWKEVVRDVDLLASSTRPADLMEQFIRCPGVKEVLAKGATKTSVRLENGLQVDLRVVEDEQFPCALNYFTGSKEHNVLLRQLAQKKNLKLSEYALEGGSQKIEIREEADLYRALDLPYLSPEQREVPLDMRTLQLIEAKDLKGTFHSHTSWSDGVDDLVSMAEKARSMGLRYLGLSDHSKAASYANGLDAARLREQMREIDRLNRGWKDFRILKGLECDILPDGSLDLHPQVLSELDFVIGSVHSGFEQPEPQMTDRIRRALANEHLDFLGHPTGRLLLSREGYRVNLDQVLAAAAEHGKVVELNAYPNRLDLDAVHCRKARDLGVMLSINPDAHSVNDLENLEYGIGTARRAGLEAKHVLNTRDLDEVLDLLSR